MLEQPAKAEKKIPLMEMFGPTIQGEGAMIGVQTYFFRFGLCDYKCTMCDSMHAVDPKNVKANAKYLTNSEILYEFRDFYKQGSTKWITLSGGNPCIHDLTQLIRGLKADGFKIAVETQGTFAPDWLLLCDQVTVSPKGPGMGEKLSLPALDNFMAKLNTHRDLNMKVVIFDQRDLELSKMLIERYVAIGALRPESFYLSCGNDMPPPVHGHLDIPHDAFIHNLTTAYEELYNEIKLDPMLSSVRFLPQWHVYVWGNGQGH